jgi:transposase
VAGTKVSPAQLRRRYAADGLSTRQLANLYGVSASTVRRWLREAGIPRRPPGGQSRAPSRQELCRLYQAEGLTTAQLGERYGVSQQTAHRWLRTGGITARPRGRAPGRQHGPLLTAPGRPRRCEDRMGDQPRR